MGSAGHRCRPFLWPEFDLKMLGHDFLPPARRYLLRLLLGFGSLLTPLRLRLAVFGQNDFPG